MIGIITKKWWGFFPSKVEAEILQSSHTYRYSQSLHTSILSFDKDQYGFSLSSRSKSCKVISFILPTILICCLTNITYNKHILSTSSPQERESLFPPGKTAINRSSLHSYLLFPNHIVYS